MKFIQCAYYVSRSSLMELRSLLVNHLRESIVWSTDLKDSQLLCLNHHHDDEGPFSPLRPSENGCSANWTTEEPNPGERVTDGALRFFLSLLSLMSTKRLCWALLCVEITTDGRKPCNGCFFFGENKIKNGPDAWEKEVQFLHTPTESKLPYLLFAWKFFRTDRKKYAIFWAFGENEDGNVRIFWRFFFHFFPRVE